MNKIRYGIPCEYALTTYPEHFTKGKRYTVDINDNFITNGGTEIFAGFGEDRWLKEVPNKNIIGGKLI